VRGLEISPAHRLAPDVKRIGHLAVEEHGNTAEIVELPQRIRAVDQPARANRNDPPSFQHPGIMSVFDPVRDCDRRIDALSQPRDAVRARIDINEQVRMPLSQ
jgi:hypothetical protein